MKSRRFIDSVAITVEAGDGGNGCVSFRREKYEPHGGPNGGDGGNGGSVVLVGSRDVTSLERLSFSPHQRAEKGEHGRGKEQHGRSGRDRRVPVPCGTEVWTAETDELLGDIIEDGQELVAARGGKGGLGNRHWKTSTHQAPREHTDGEPGETARLRLDLKLMADIGLVGFPNAGKSSLLTGVSDAHPKVGAYPFTTLNPIIGTIIFEDYSRVTAADIPGLIEGAHSGVGLGDAFLRHVERARALMYVIDMAAVDGRDPCEDYLSLVRELDLYKPHLSDRPSLVVANKMDVPEAEENLREFVERTGVRPVPVSALKKQGLHALKKAIRGLPLA